MASADVTNRELCTSQQTFGLTLWEIMERVYSGLTSECCHLETLDQVVADLGSFQPFANKRRGQQKVSHKLIEKQFAFNCAYVEYHRYRQSNYQTLPPFEKEHQNWQRGWERSFWRASGLPAVEQYKTEWLSSQPRFLKHLVLGQYYKLMVSKYGDSESVRNSNRLTEEELQILCQHYDPEYASSGGEDGGEVEDAVAGDSEAEDLEPGSMSCEVYMDESKPNAVGRIVVNKLNGGGKEGGPSSVTVKSTTTTTTVRRTLCVDGCFGCLKDKLPYSELCKGCWLEMRSQEHDEYCQEAEAEMRREDDYN